MATNRPFPATAPAPAPATEMSRGGFLKTVGAAGVALAAGAALGGLTAGGAGPARAMARATGLSTGFSPDDPLMPTGDSTKDTHNLQAAVHDTRMDSGGTLRLGPGTFLVHASVVRQVHDQEAFGYNPRPFNGTVQGAGKDVTIVRSVRGPGGAAFTQVYDPLANTSYPMTFWLTDQEYIGVRDMTFEADSEIADEWSYGGWFSTRGLLAYVLAGSGSEFQGGELGSDCVNVHFKGSLDSSGRPEMVHIFEFYSGGGGTHNCKSCEFENGRSSMLVYAVLANATINVGGGPDEKVTFTNARTEAVSVENVIDSTVNVVHLETSDAPGLLFGSGEENRVSSVKVTNSQISQRADTRSAGVELWGEYGETDVLIANNEFHTKDAVPPYGPIFSLGVNEAEVTDNVFTGSGVAAIYGEPFSFLSLPRGGEGAGWQISNNQLAGFEPRAAPSDYLPAAHILLGPGTSDFTVTGGDPLPNDVRLLDFGSGNSVSGMEHVKGDPQQVALDGLRKRLPGRLR